MTTVRRQAKLQERLEAVRLARPGEKGEERGCCWPGCERPGRYPAPRSRERLRDFIWFCLEHVREYNRNWDYFAGMSAEEIDAHRFRDFTWHRPSWPFGVGFDPLRARFRDAHGIFEDGGEPSGRPANGFAGRAREMADRLGLEPGFTLAELKDRYKRLVKKYHPDLNGACREAEERLKLINEAYTYLLGQRLYL